MQAHLLLQKFLLFLGRSHASLLLPAVPFNLFHEAQNWGWWETGNPDLIMCYAGIKDNVRARPPTWSCARVRRGRCGRGTVGAARLLEAERINLWRAPKVLIMYTHCDFPVARQYIILLLFVQVTHLASHVWTDQTFQRRQALLGPLVLSHKTPVGVHNLRWKSHTAG